ncbi:MAG: hypothetical protein CVU09_01285 [Bacteroidetes bacterium HGW-Bacteroidetes-4]|jgi:hypothetical protein|nr:MAG: hypothetical protein CVU09_01285 [Bacteroidetes bacterium HGW-Bacteroidetes-4]
MSSHKTVYTKAQIGCIFTFTLKKELQVENDVATYYVIEDPQQSRFLIPKLNYEHFGFKPGDILHCTLDQINCKGEIFFEPVNPYYEKGKSYRFKHQGRQVISNYFGLSEQVIKVTDVFGQEQWVRFAAGIDLKDGELLAEVVYIKKGKLFLIPRGHFEYKSGRLWGRFKVIAEFITERFNESLLLKDSAGNDHVMIANAYQNYNLKPGTNFLGLISAFSSKGFVYIEPEHPHYKLDEFYKFLVVDTLNDKTGWFAFVEDNRGEVFKINSYKEPLVKGSRVNLRVKDWNKGKPVLEILN